MQTKDLNTDKNQLQVSQFLGLNAILIRNLIIKCVKEVHLPLTIKIGIIEI